MGEMTMVMMKIRGHEPSATSTTNPSFVIDSSSVASPAWKLYENPFYSCHENQQEHEHATDQKQIHRLHLPVSARKLAASFWDLTFIKPFVESELGMTRAQVGELKAELECERKERKKLECLNKRLVKEVSEEKRGREALERMCAELARQISSEKAEINRMKKGIEEERKMLRVAEVIREERVQMKLAEAKILLEEKFSELGIEKNLPLSSSNEVKKDSQENQMGNANKMTVVQRKSPPEAENPHIKRGIKGFVEFPKVARAIGCRSGKQLSSKLECQQAQLKILLKQRGPVRFNGFIAS